MIKGVMLRLVEIFTKEIIELNNENRKMYIYLT